MCELRRLDAQTRRAIKSDYSEGYEQKLVFAYLRKNKIPAFAIPNGGWRTKRTATGLQYQGVERGVPDLFVCVPSSRYHGLFIEMKKTKGHPSDVRPEQKDWIKRLTRLRYKSVVCYGHEVAIELINEYLRGSKWMKN